MEVWVLVYKDGGIVEDAQVFASETEARTSYASTVGGDLDLDEDPDTILLVAELKQQVAGQRLNRAVLTNLFKVIIETDGMKDEIEVTAETWDAALGAVQDFVDHFMRNPADIRIQRIKE